MRSFNNKVAAITGAGSGIGQALALNLAQQGCDLALADLNETGMRETLELAKKHGVKVSTQLLDVSDKDAMFAWADKVVAEHGKVNLIFNNAGVALSGTVASLSVEDYEWIMSINFWGVLYGTKAFLPYLEQSGAGHVINISSTMGLTAQAMMSGYNCSKFAVRGFTESLRQDLDITDSNVSATCVHPGGIKTNIAQSSRMSDSVSSITGVDKKKAIAEFERTFITSADKAAQIILKAVQNNKRRVLVGKDAYFYDWIVRLFPTAYQRLFNKVIKWRSEAVKKAVS